VRCAKEALRLKPELAEAGIQHEVDLQSKEFTVGGVDVFFSGKIDVYDPKAKTVIDIKCSGNSEPKNYNAQLGAYGKILADNRRKPEKAEIVWIPIRSMSRNSKQPEGAVDEYDLATAKGVAIHAVRRCIDAHEAYEKRKDPNDIQPDSNYWACSANNCVAHGTEACRMTFAVTRQPDPKY